MPAWWDLALSFRHSGGDAWFSAWERVWFWIACLEMEARRAGA